MAPVSGKVIVARSSTPIAPIPAWLSLFRASQLSTLPLEIPGLGIVEACTLVWISTYNKYLSKSCFGAARDPVFFSSACFATIVATE